MVSELIILNRFQKLSDEQDAPDSGDTDLSDDGELTDPDEEEDGEDENLDKGDGGLESAETEE